MNIDLSDAAAWDDTELVDAYERAISSYMARGATPCPPRRPPRRLPTLPVAVPVCVCVCETALQGHLCEYRTGKQRPPFSAWVKEMLESGRTEGLVHSSTGQAWERYR